MRFTTLVPMLLAAGVAHAQFGGKQNGQGQNAQNNKNNNAAAKATATAAAAAASSSKNNNNNQNGQGNAALTLNPANVQTASNTNGLAQADAGQAASDTDPANFINFCTGKTLTNGLQVRGGSCNGIVMGDMPASNKMISAVMLNPTNGQNVAPNTAIDFTVKIANLKAGTFTNPDTTYYAAPQALTGGVVVGHTHITVQDLGNNLNPTNPLDAQTFAFFKGINDAGDGAGTLKASLAAGLPQGNYRVCSMTSSSNHAPVIMPVAQRGAQDDCVRFTVSANGGGNNNNQQGQAKQSQAQATQATQAKQGEAQASQATQAKQGQAQATQAKQGQAQATQGQAQQQAQQGKGKGKGKARFGRRKFSAREFIA